MVRVWPDDTGSQPNKAALHPASLVQPDAGTKQPLHVSFVSSSLVVMMGRTLASKNNPSTIYTEE